MIKNGGIIGPQNLPSQASATGFAPVSISGIYDSFQAYNHVRQATWPQQIRANWTSVTPSFTPTEGTAFTVKINLSKATAGLTLHYTIVSLTGSVLAADFTDGLMTGTFTTYSEWGTTSSGEFTKTLVSEDGIETDSFYIEIRLANSSGMLLATTSTITPIDFQNTTVWNFFSNSAPAGITTNTADPYVWSGSAYQYGWSSTYGLMTAGSATFARQYVVGPTQSYVGDYLIQASFKCPSSNAPDPSIAIWPVANGRTNASGQSSASYVWGANTSRIAVTAGVATSSSNLFIFGNNNSANPTEVSASLGNVGSGNFNFVAGTWYTLHFWHLPSLSTSRAACTIGQDDWTVSGTRFHNPSTLLLGSTISATTQFYYSSSTQYYVGISSDWNQGSYPQPTGMNFSGMRTSKL
ncbi:hypothetical protein EBS67_12190 [bacterium]|nr:hypothetical protein [bacterium]NBT62744.1 hypothetical protein [Planctomycetia bacterium]